jgi:hypothetical protein
MDERIRRVEDLEVFRRAYQLSLEVHRASLEFPRIEQWALADQVRRSSKSICANLAEGFAKQSYSAAEYRRYLHGYWQQRRGAAMAALLYRPEVCRGEDGSEVDGRL